MDSCNDFGRLRRLLGTPGDPLRERPGGTLNDFLLGTLIGTMSLVALGIAIQMYPG